MNFLSKLQAAHDELVEEQRVLIADEMQAKRRGDHAAAERYRRTLDRIAKEMRTIERMYNDETGTEHWVVGEGAS